MPRDQNAVQNYTIKTSRESFKSLEQFTCLGTTQTNQNSIFEEIKSGNVCYHLLHNLLSSSMRSKNMKIKIYIIVNFPVVLYGRETWSVI